MTHTVGRGSVRLAVGVPRWLVVCLFAWSVLTAAGARGDEPQVQPETEVAKPAEKGQGAKDGEEAKPADGADKKEGADEKKEGDEKKEEGEKPAEGDKKQKPKPRNPLTDLIIRSMQPARGAPAIPGATTEPVPANKAASPKHPKDATAPYDSKGANWMMKAQSQAKEGEWKSALDLLQKVSELPEDSLYLDAGGTWVSLRGAADRLRGEAPPDMLEQYRVQFGGLAQQLLNEAIRSGRPAGLGKVARGYFHTPAGYEAANRLGSYHLERGEYASAARWFQALWNSRPPLTEDPQWKLKAAYALKSAALGDSAQKLVDDVGTQRAVVGGKPREAAPWWQASASPISLDSGPQSNWPVNYGTAARTGRQRGGSPLLLARWHHRLTDSEPVRDQITNLLEDLADSQSGPIPVINPILVDGLVAYRTLHGVQVVDVESGRPIWSSMEQQTLDRLLSGQQMAQPNFNGMMMRGGFFGGWNGGGFGYNVGMGEGAPLCHLLFRNANFGLLSSDGVRLFIVEDSQFLTNQQPGQTWFNPNADTGPSIGTRLTAYDLRTGRPLWEVGGSANGEELDLPLAGYFLFGPPVFDGSEMYVIGESTTGERSGQIRLLCLDPASGAELWSQLIAYADTGIEKDIGRRWFAAQPALENGLIFCPTTVGWLVAVDRTTHSVVWGFRPPRPNAPRNLGPDGSEMGQMVQQFGLSTVWHAAPPITAGGRVIYTPTDPQVQTLYCVDQSTGKELWAKPRGAGMYLAGVFDGLAITVGRDTTVAYRVANGEIAWSLKHTLPSGRGVAVEGNYHLPLAGGEVWTFSLTTGEVSNKTYLPDNQPGGVGNLLMCQGMLLSIDPFGLTAFEQKEAVVEDIARRKGANPNDPVALLREADIALLQREFDQALGLLHKVPADQLAPADQKRHRGNLISTLAAVIRADFTRPETDASIEELAKLVAGPDETLMLRRLQADRYLAGQEYVRAFDAYLQLADDSGGRLVPQEETPGVMVRADLWVAGKIIDLLAAVPEGERAGIVTRVEQLAEVAMQGSPDDRRRFLMRFPEHPAGISVRLKYAADFAADRNFVMAEAQLRRIIRTADAPRAAQAAEQLARLLNEFGLPDDARLVATDLGFRWKEVELAPGRTGQQVAEALLTEIPAPATARKELGWRAAGIKVERMAANYQNYVTQELTGLSPRTPFFGRYRFDVDPQSQRLEVIDGQDEVSFWSHPLRTSTNGTDGGIPFGKASGHRVVMLSQGVLNCISPVERRVLWTRALDSRNSGQYYNRQQTPFLAMRTISSGGNRQPIQLPQLHGAFAMASDEVVCLLGRRNLTVLDLDTGEVRWTMQGSRVGMSVTGGNRVLYLSQLDPQQQQQMAMMGVSAVQNARVRGLAGPAAMLLIYGKRVEVPKLKDLQSKALMACGDDFILQGTFESGLEMRRFDPVSGTDRWKLALRKGALASVIDSERLAVLEPPTKEIKESKLTIVDLEDGRQQVLEIAETDVKAKNELFVFSDPDTVYLIVNKPGGQTNYYNEQLPYVRVNGLVQAFNARDGKVRWKQTVLGQNLLLERFEFMPLMLFVTRKFENKGMANFWSMHLIAIDKLSGTKMLDEKSAQQPGFRSLAINAQERYLELRGWNDRTRLYATDETASAVKPGPAATPEPEKAGEKKPEPPKPEPTKPEAAPAGEAKPADKPAADDTKPEPKVEAKPAAETPSPEKPTEAKSTEAKPNTP
ncbi:MAG: PQQ-binding-like beta-propeller repeat protein [Planctomycetota bacterium]|nr:PQQ-binding-like beta-propeller repeat protein [Planctomycetota bacterium]